MKFQTVWCKTLRFELPKGGGQTDVWTEGGIIHSELSPLARCMKMSMHCLQHSAECTRGNRNFWDHWAREEDCQLCARLNPSESSDQCCSVSCRTACSRSTFPLQHTRQEHRTRIYQGKILCSDWNNRCSWQSKHARTTCLLFLSKPVSGEPIWWK